jgi:hypothetical protein
MRRSAHIFLVVVSVLSCAVSTFAQEKLWKELTDKCHNIDYPFLDLRCANTSITHSENLE